MKLDHSDEIFHNTVHIWNYESFLEKKGHTQIADDSTGNLCRTSKFGNCFLCTILYFNVYMSLSLRIKVFLRAEEIILRNTNEKGWHNGKCKHKKIIKSVSRMLNFPVFSLSPTILLQNVVSILYDVKMCWKYHYWWMR